MLVLNRDLAPPTEAHQNYHSDYHRDFLSLPDGIVWYRHRSQEDQDHQHAYDQLGEIDDSVRDAFEISGQGGSVVPYEKHRDENGGSVSRGLRRVIQQLGPAGAVPYLEKTLQLNHQKIKELRAMSAAATEGEMQAKGRRRASEEGELIERVMTEDETGQLRIFDQITDYVLAGKTEVEPALNDKMNRLVELFRRFEREAEEAGVEGEWRCLLIGAF
jgi:hypothetical protein